jgi:hypothetical protein
MSVTSVASSTVFPSSAAASQPVALSVTSKPAAAGTTLPSVINSISSGTSIVTTASDIQSSINGINAGIQIYARLDWSKLSGITSEEIANAESLQAEHVQAAESATITRADEEGVQGVSFNFLPIEFSKSTSGAQPSISIPAASQAATETSDPDPAVTPAAVTSSASPASSTLLQATSSQNQGSPQTPSLILSAGAASTSTSAANVALSILTAANQQSSSQPATTPTTRQVYDIYA